MEYLYVDALESILKLDPSRIRVEVAYRESK